MNIVYSHTNIESNNNTQRTTHNTQQPHRTARVACGGWDGPHLKAAAAAQEPEAAARTAHTKWTCRCGFENSATQVHCRKCKTHWKQATVMLPEMLQSIPDKVRFDCKVGFVQSKGNERQYQITLEM